MVLGGSEDVIFPTMSLSTTSAAGTTTKRRSLRDDEGGYFVDADGNSYEPYSLAWRYLGLFIDCSSNNNGRSRTLNENDNNSGCQRRLLWAAYHDEKYKGGSIGEYSIYDRRNSVWETRSCRAQTWWPFTRCKRMDCHQRRTSWKLVGVYKETDGLEDWSEQLFKHQGYCLWGADQDEEGSGSGDSRDGNEQQSSDYEFMQDYRENWSSGCQQLENVVDADGNYLYSATKPLRGGDMTIGVYTDASCLVESSVQWSDYLESYGDDDGNDSVSTWQSLVDRWNDLLSDYKVCQPCRAYSLSRSGGGSHDGSGDEEDGDDGEGGAEQWGFNCYDDAGYQNCNQCYKFATQTDMEEASVADLQEASSQGTILPIRVDGNMYGNGRLHDASRATLVFKRTSISVLFMGAIMGLAFLYYKFSWLPSRRVQNLSLKDDLTTKTQNDSDSDETDRKTRRRSSRHKQRSGRSQGRADPPSDGRSQQNLWVQLRARDVRLEQQSQEIDELRRELEWYKKRAKKREEAPTNVEHSDTF